MVESARDQDHVEIVYTRTLLLELMAALKDMGVITAEEGFAMHDRAEQRLKDRGLI